MIERDLSDPDGIIFVRGTGVWTREDVDVHYGELRRIIEERRERGDPIRLLSDVTKAERQAPEIEAHIMWHINQTFLPGDRIAMLVADTDVKTYVRALLGKAYIGTFSSRLPAEMWLMYEGLAPPGY